MAEVRVARKIDRPSQELWKVISNLGEIYRFHPMVESSPMLSEETGGVGAKRVCNFTDGRSLVEEVIEWEEGRSYTVAITESFFPVLSPRTTFRIDRLNERQSVVVLRMQYTPKWGFIGKIMNTLMMKPMLTRAFRGVLDGLNDYVSKPLEIRGTGLPILQTHHG